MSVQYSNLPLTLKSDQKLCMNAIFSIRDIIIVLYIDVSNSEKIMPINKRLKITDNREVINDKRLGGFVFTQFIDWCFNDIF